MKTIDDFLNNITMYRLVLYYLIILVTVAALYSLVGALPFSIFFLLYSIIFLVLVCWIVNTVFAKVWQIPTNVESVYITALILSLIVSPMKSFSDMPALLWIAVLAMSSKYILAINKKNLFNPAALAVAITAFTIATSASWWVGTAAMLPVVLVGSLLIIRKLRRFDLFLSFILVALISIITWSWFRGTQPILALQKALLDSPIIFFAGVMLAEPLTTPVTKKMRILYGSLVGLLFSPQVHLLAVYSTPELSLLIGNIFAYLVSPKYRLILRLKNKLQVAPDIYDFIFSSSDRLQFKAGQFLEWTLGYPNPDSRGNRRFFTLASSPTEQDLRIGVKFYPNGSGFKTALRNLLPGSEMIASQLSGEFTLPKDANKKLVFIAGGIGVTPFRSMVKFLIDTNQKRDMVLFFSNKLVSDIVYVEIFSAAQSIGLRTIYTLTEKEQIPPGWQGQVGYVDEKMIQEQVPDFRERLFYLSGPHGMVSAFEKTLSKIGVPRSQIKVDYFPGYV